MIDRSTIQRRLRRAGAWAVPRLAFAIAVFGALCWARVVWDKFPPDKDWRLFRDTAVLLASGRVGEIYPGVTPKLPFFYPPFFVWQVWPLGLLSPGAAYVAVLLTTVASTALALWALRAALDHSGLQPVESWLWVVLSSAGWIWTLCTAHLSGWYLALLSVALLLWMRDRRFWAGAVLGLVLTKPNYGLLVLLCLAAGRAWRMLGGAAAVAGLLTLSTAPLGWRIWPSFLKQVQAVSAVVDADQAMWRQATLHAFWMSTVGTAHVRWATALWALCALPCLALAMWAWARARSAPALAPRLLGVTVLLLFCCSPYGFHYDALLLALPGLVWYLRPESYFSARSHLVCGVAIGCAYLAQHLNALVFRGGPAVTGLAAAVWLVCEVADLAAGLRRAAAALPAPALACDLARAPPAAAAVLATLEAPP